MTNHPPTAEEIRNNLAGQSEESGKEELIRELDEKISGSLDHAHENYFTSMMWRGQPFMLFPFPTLKMEALIDAGIRLADCPSWQTFESRMAQEGFYVMPLPGENMPLSYQGRFGQWCKILGENFRLLINNPQILNRPRNNEDGRGPWKLLVAVNNADLFAGSQENTRTAINEAVARKDAGIREEIITAYTNDALRYLWRLAKRGQWSEATPVVNYQENPRRHEYRQDTKMRPFRSPRPDLDKMWRSIRKEALGRLGIPDHDDKPCLLKNLKSDLPASGVYRQALKRRDEIVTQWIAAQETHWPEEMRRSSNGEIILDLPQVYRITNSKPFTDFCATLESPRMGYTTRIVTGNRLLITA